MIDFIDSDVVAEVVVVLAEAMRHELDLLDASLEARIALLERTELAHDARVQRLHRPQVVLSRRDAERAVRRQVLKYRIARQLVSVVVVVVVADSTGIRVYRHVVVAVGWIVGHGRVVVVAGRHDGESVAIAVERAVDQMLLLLLLLLLLVLVLLVVS